MKRKWTNRVARVAKRVVLKASETKRYTFLGPNTAVNGANTVIPLFSNGGATVGATGPFITAPLFFIDQGDTIQTRTGDRIILKGMHLKLQVEGDPNRLGNTHVRVSMAWIDPNLTLSSIVFQNLYLSAISTANTTTNAFIRQKTDNDRIIRRLVFDKVYSLAPTNPLAASLTSFSQIPQRIIRIHIPFHNKMYQFINGSSGAAAENEDLIMFITAYKPGDTAGDTQVANVRMFGKVYFKDP